MTEPRTNQINLRLTDTERATLRALADGLGCTMTEAIVAAVNEKAERQATALGHGQTEEAPGNGIVPQNEVTK
jgi:hypothetical protein